MEIIQWESSLYFINQGYVVKIKNKRTEDDFFKICIKTLNIS